MGTPVVAVRDLVKEYPGAIRAVDGITFGVGAGEFFGFLGPNGAGKTTTLRILTTLARPTSGRATVFGHDVVTAALEIRKQIGVVIQEQAAATTS